MKLLRSNIKMAMPSKRTLWLSYSWIWMWSTLDYPSKQQVSKWSSSRYQSFAVHLNGEHPYHRLGWFLVYGVVKECANTKWLHHRKHGDGHFYGWNLIKFTSIESGLMSVLQFETASLVVFWSRILIFYISKTVSYNELLYTNSKLEALSVYAMFWMSKLFRFHHDETHKQFQWDSPILFTHCD